MGPSVTIGALNRRWRSAPIKVVVFQCPCGAEAMQRFPLGARPQRRVMLVDVHVSSMNTSFSTSNLGNASTHARRRVGRHKSQLRLHLNTDRGIGGHDTYFKQFGRVAPVSGESYQADGARPERSRRIPRNWGPGRLPTSPSPDSRLCRSFPQQSANSI